MPNYPDYGTLDTVNLNSPRNETTISFYTNNPDIPTKKLII